MFENNMSAEEILALPVETGEVVNVFLHELESFSSQYEFLGSIRYEEYREFDSVENEYYIENIHDMSPLELVPTIKAIEDHMKEFSKSKGIFRFYLSTRILFE